MTSDIAGDGPLQFKEHVWVWLTQPKLDQHPPNNHAYIINWWVWPHKNYFCTHFEKKNLSPCIIIIPDHHVLEGKESWHCIFKELKIEYHLHSEPLVSILINNLYKIHQTKPKTITGGKYSNLHQWLISWKISDRVH